MKRPQRPPHHGSRLPAEAPHHSCSYLARVRPMPLSANLGTRADSQRRGRGRDAPRSLASHGGYRVGTAALPRAGVLVGGVLSLSVP